eukprot:XP_001695082.1 predicted protein [Chlamydomonas reinhardtii]
MHMRMQLDAAALAARTKAHWGPLHTAARAPHRQLAVEVTELLLRRGEQLGLFTEEAMQQRGTSVSGEEADRLCHARSSAADTYVAARVRVRHAYLSCMRRCCLT